jgi:hypothetical protein
LELVEEPPANEYKSESLIYLQDNKDEYGWDEYDDFYPDVNVI